MKKGKLIIISGPSGVGKKTILEEIYKDVELNIIPSISMTTRKPRFNEVNGKDYFFVTEEEFRDGIKKNKFLEYTKYNENYYGTPKDFIDKEQNNGKNILLEIETFGVQKINKQNIDTLKIFIMPPSIDELKKRLLKRQTENLETINKRIEEAKREIKLLHLYDYNIVNDKLQDAIKDLKKILKNEIYE